MFVNGLPKWEATSLTKQTIADFFFSDFFFIGGKLLYNVVLVSAVQ